MKRRVDSRPEENIINREIRYQEKRKALQSDKRMGGGGSNFYSTREATPTAQGLQRKASPSELNKAIRKVVADRPAPLQA